MASKLVAELVLEVGKMQAGLRRAQNSLARASKRGGKKIGDMSAKGIALGMAGGAVAITAGLVAVVSAAAIVAGINAGRTIAKAVAEAAQNERFQMRFEVLTGSRGAGNRALQTLREDAMRTGIALEDMADNVGKFIAFGFSGGEAVDLQRGILDVGGAVGLTTRDMKLLGVALSQVAAKGVANMEELRQQIAEKGIPIFKALEQQLGVTGAELSKMVQEGKVSADVVLDLFKGAAKGEGPFERFAGGADKMASTFLGTIQRMKTSYAEFLRIMGGPIREALLPILEAAYKHVDGMRAKAEQWGTAVANVITGMIAVVKTLKSMDLREFGRAYMDAFDALDPKLRRFYRKVGDGLKEGVSSGLQQAMDGFFKWWVDSSSGMFDGLWTSALSALEKELTNALSRSASKFLRDMVEGMNWVNKQLVGKGMLQIADGLDKNTERNEVDIDAARKKFRVEVAKAMGYGMDQVEEVISAAGGGFKKGFDNAGAELISGFGELSGKMGPLVDEWDKNYRALKKERDDRLAAKDTLIGAEMSFGGGGTEADGAGGAAGGGGFGLNGRLAQSVNTISGRNAFTVIATEGKKTNEQLLRANKSLEEIARNTRDKSSRTAAGSPVGPVSPVIFK